MHNPNAAVARRWFDEVWNQRRSETIGELLTADSVCYTEDGPIRGPDEFRDRLYTPLMTAFPDVNVTVDAVLTEGDQIVVRWTAQATHAGPGLGLVPTQRPVTFRGMTWMRIDGGKLIEGWQQTNIAETIRSLAAG